MMQRSDFNLSHLRRRKTLKDLRQKTLHMGSHAPGVNITKTLALAAHFEDAELVRKLKAGK